MKKQILNQSGELSAGETETPSGTQSTSAESTQPQASRPISVMLDSTARQSQDSQHTKTQEADMETPNTTYAKLIHAAAAKLGVKVEWIKVKLRNGKSGYALFFDSSMWAVDPQSKELKES